MKLTRSLQQSTSLPAKAGGERELRYPYKALLALCFVSVLSLFWVSGAQAALELKSPPAMLAWSMATLPVYSNVKVLRYDRVGFYYYDPAATTSFQVWEGKTADKDSLSGAPNWLNGAVPAPMNVATGLPLPLNTSLPLTQAFDREFGGDEPMFIVAQGPILPATAYNTRPDGREFMAVTVDAGGGYQYIVTLTETAPGSRVYAGYLQPNLSWSPIVIPPGSEMKILYDDYGDVPDSQTIYAPWNVSLPDWERVDSHRRGTTSNLPLPDKSLFLRKQAQRSVVSLGDFLKYQLTLENVGQSAMAAVEIIDLLPAGFRYQARSARLDNTPIDPFVSPTARELTFTLGTLPAGGTATITYVVEVTALAKPGKAVNSAVAHSGNMASSPANASVLVEQPLNKDRAFLMGRVIDGECGDDTAPGLKGVRIYMEDGTNVVTDAKGRWSLPGVIAGLHVLQVDSITLRPNYRLRSCFNNTRKAGNTLSRFVDVQGGTLWRENWYAEVIPGSVVPDAESDQATPSNDAAAKPGATAKPVAGFINLQNGTTFPQPVFSAIAQMDSRLKPTLLLNGTPIPDTRIGMRIADKETGLTRYTWIGLELSQIGTYKLELQGADPFGNVRFNQAIEVRRSGRIKTIRVAEVQQNSADGRTPIAVKLQIIDEYDKLLTSGVDLQVVSGELRPLNASQSSSPLESRGNIVRVDSHGIARFEPVGTAGNYRITLAADDNVKAEIDVPVAPDLREWILVGFAEGTYGHNTLSGNMNALEDEEEHSYFKGKSAFFARGQIKGEWLLTASYDSRRGKEDNALLQRIDPQKWYVLYGDDTLRAHDAPSSKKLYVRIERADFYAMFGDYNTGLSVTELANYSRTLTGVKTEYTGANVSATGFAAKTDQGFVRDDIAADGTSGLYRLSRGSILPGSEEIETQVRDRFTNEVISTLTMVRYIDYNIDYQDGSLYFRTPMFSQDENFNPRRIVVRYEVTAGAEKWVTGGRVSLHDRDKKVEVGITRVDDDQAEGDLTGIDATWKPNDSHTVKAEAALTKNDVPGGGNIDAKAWMVEHTYTSESFDSRIRVEEKEGDFGLGQLGSDEDDIRTALVSTRYRIDDEWAISGDATNQEILSNHNQRSTVEGRVEYTQDDWSAHTGLRYSRDYLNSDTNTARQVVLGARRSMLDKRLVLSVRGETSAQSNTNVDYPNLVAVGADYQLTPKSSLFVNQEFSWGAERQTQEARVGVRTSPWEGGTVSTEVRRSQDEHGPRLMAHSGVFQTLQISDNWTADLGLDRSQSISQSSTPADTFDSRRPLAFGSNNAEDYTAMFLGAGYQTAEWQWTNRVEYRHAELDDKWSFLSGFYHRLDQVDTLTGRILHFSQQTDSGVETRSTQFDFSFARRPLSDRAFWLNRTQLIFDTQNDASGEVQGRRLVNNTMVNFVRNHRHQLALHYGARYVTDTIDDQHFTGYSDLMSSEYRYDITPRWDVGFRVSLLNSYASKVHERSYGIMAGHSPVKDVWISLGYNFKGFYDKDFDNAESRTKGVVLNFRIKFDQDGVRRMTGRK